MKKDNPRVTTNSDSLSLIAGLQSGTCLIFKDRVFLRPDAAHFQSHLGFPFKQYQAAVSLTLADDRIFCFYPKPPLTFSISLGKLQLRRLPQGNRKCHRWLWIKTKNTIVS